MWSIGEFSKASGIPVRTLRFYHELGLLIPTAVDPTTNYRSYDRKNLEVARVIVSLRELEFPLDDIREILAGCNDDVDVLTYLERQREALRERFQHYRDALKRIDQLLKTQQESRMQDELNTATFQIAELELKPTLVAGIQMMGRYSDCGQGYARLYRRLGRHVTGPALCLFYDGEYRDDDANFETCVPLSKRVTPDGFEVRELAGGKCLSLMHRGPYDELSYSYARALEYVNTHGYEIRLPTREVYHKGPGMFFRGNPNKYLTEIQLLIQS